MSSLYMNLNPNLNLDSISQSSSNIAHSSMCSYSYSDIYKADSTDD